MNTVAGHPGAFDHHWGDLVPDFLCLCRDGVIVHVNRAGAAIVGASSPEALIGRRLAEFVHDDYAPLVEDGLDVLADGETVPLMFRTEQGEPVEVEVRAAPADPDDPGAYVLHARDISERLRQVNHVLQSEQRYRSLVDLALDMICLVSDEAVTVINRAGRQLLECPDADYLIGRPVRDMVHPDYHALLDLGLETLAEEDQLVPLKFVTCGGVAVDVEMRVRGLDQPGAFMIEARDIRARLRSAEAVREREARLQGILDTVAEGIITADDHGIIQSFNRAAETIFGHKARDVIGRNLSVLMPAPFAQAHDGLMTAYRGGGSAVGAPVLGQRRELQGLRADGSVFPLELNISELRLGKARLLTGIIRDITARKRAEEAEQRYKQELEVQVEERTRDLRRVSRQFQSILDSAGDGIIGLSLNGRITFANPAASAILGWREGDMVGRDAEQVFRHGTGPRTGRSVPVRAALRRRVFNEHTELVLMRADGATVAVEYGSSALEDDGELTGAVVVLRDITDRKAAEERLRVAAAVFETTVEGVLVFTADGTVTMANPALSHILRAPAGQSLAAFTVAELLFAGQPALWGDLTRAVADGRHWEQEFWSCRQDGEEFAARLVASPVVAEGGGRDLAVLVVNDITQRKRDEERIRYQANHDMLTGLPNRSLFHDRLDQAVRAARRTGLPMALMFIDLDGFKAVNDTLGHEAGDHLLIGAAQRLSDCVRDSDTVARLGGDEFTVILSVVDGAAGAAVLAQRLIDALEVPFDLDGRVGRVSGSVGIAVLPEHGVTADDILRNADAAMYHAKAQGKANFQFFRPELAPPERVG